MKCARDFIYCKIDDKYSLNLRVFLMDCLHPHMRREGEREASLQMMMMRNSYVKSIFVKFFLLHFSLCVITLMCTACAHTHTQSGWNILCQYLVNAVKYHREISKVLFFIFGCHYPKSTTAATTTVKMNLEVNTKWLLPTLRVPAWVCECECVCRNLLLITNLSHVSTLFLPAAKMCQIHTQIDTWIRDWRETHTCRGSTRENLSLFQCVSES